MNAGDVRKLEGQAVPQKLFGFFGQVIFVAFDRAFFLVVPIVNDAGALEAEIVGPPEILKFMEWILVERLHVLPFVQNLANVTPLLSPIACLRSAGVKSTTSASDRLI